MSLVRVFYRADGKVFVFHPDLDYERYKLKLLISWIKSRPSNFMDKEWLDRKPADYGDFEWMFLKPLEYRDGEWLLQKPIDFANVEFLLLKPEEENEVDWIKSKPLDFMNKEWMSKKPKDFMATEWFAEKPKDFMDDKRLSEKPSNFGSQEWLDQKPSDPTLDEWIGKQLVIPLAKNPAKYSGMEYEDMDTSQLPQNRADRDRWRGTKVTGIKIDPSVVLRKDLLKQMDDELAKANPNTVAVLRLQRKLDKREHD
jgi:hypothetical protein